MMPFLLAEISFWRLCPKRKVLNDWLNKSKPIFFLELKKKLKNSSEQGRKQVEFYLDNPQEPMLSYTQHRRRWWKVLTDLDFSMVLSDGLRMELMLELSGLSRQEVLVVKAYTATKDFEGVAKVLVDQYSGIHLREGSKSWVGRLSTPQQYGKFGKGYGSSKGPQSGKGSYKTAYTMPIPMRKAMVMVTMMNTKRNIIKRMHHT